MKLKIWTWGYFPFSIVRPPTRPIACEVERPETLHDLGQGYKAYLITSPSGMTHVIESQTGAIVGRTIEEVSKDAAEADPIVMGKQIRESHDSVKRAEMMPELKFWKMIKGAA